MGAHAHWMLTGWCLQSDGVSDSRLQVRTADGLKYVDFAPYEDIQEVRDTPPCMNHS